MDPGRVGEGFVDPCQRIAEVEFDGALGLLENLVAADERGSSPAGRRTWYRSSLTEPSEGGPTWHSCR